MRHIAACFFSTGLRNRAGKNHLPLLARRASVSLLTHFIWTPVCIKKTLCRHFSISKGRYLRGTTFFFTHQSYQTLSGNGDKSWELTYLHFPFLHIVQFSGSKATFHAPSFKWPFSRWAILSFKGTACTPLCLYLFPICYVPNISHGSEFCQDEFFITLPLYEVS